MLTFATCLWTPNEHSFFASEVFTEDWPRLLAANVRRHLHAPHRFVCLTEKERPPTDGVIWERFQSIKDGELPRYGHFTELLRLSDDGPLLFSGLDTIVVGSLAPFVEWVSRDEGKMALPRDPGRGKQHRSINGVGFVQRGHGYIYDQWLADGGTANDMEWLRNYPNEWIDDIWPGRVVSYKIADVKRRGLGKARIVYLHGTPKQHALRDVPWVRKEWFGE